MNFLAHALLSPPDPEVMVGNLTADFIKGKSRRELSPGLQQGFTLHQRIDVFTDTHAGVSACAELFEARWGRYTVVLVDIFFDHCLARRWIAHHPEPLAVFVERTYDTVRTYHGGLPPRAQLATAAMMYDDWLGSYATLAGIELALARLSRRLKHGIDLAPAAHDLGLRLPEVEAAFEPFFAELRALLKV